MEKQYPKLVGNNLVTCNVLAKISDSEKKLKFHLIFGTSKVSVGGGIQRCCSENVMGQTVEEEKKKGKQNQLLWRNGWCPTVDGKKSCTS